MNFLGSFSRKHKGIILIPPRSLNKTDFPSITGRPAADPISPNPRIAVPLVIIAPQFLLTESLTRASSDNV